MSPIEAKGRRVPLLFNRRAGGVEGRRLRSFGLFEIAPDHLEGER